LGSQTTALQAAGSSAHRPRRVVLIATCALALVVALGLLISSMFTPGSHVRNFLEGLSGNPGPIQKDHLQMRVLLVVTRRENAEIIVLAENTSDQHIIKISDRSPHERPPIVQHYEPKITDELGNDYSHPIMKEVDVRDLVGTRVSLRPGEFVIFSIS